IFRKSQLLQYLLKRLGSTKTTFQDLRDTHVSFFIFKDINIVYISLSSKYNLILTIQNLYFKLMLEKKHQQDTDALSLIKRFI
ncbi:integrase, partial [Listeria monocytogenes]|nr:integrase [Listeria monocytogenes]